jgi:hypothetical protein
MTTKLVFTVFYVLLELHRSTTRNGLLAILQRSRRINRPPRPAFCHVPLGATIGNGQWFIFLHSHPFMIPLGSHGLVYRASPESSNADFFGWRISLIGVYSTWCEARRGGHWWNIAYMYHLLDIKFAQCIEHEHICNGLEVDPLILGTRLHVRWMDGLS